MNVVAPKSRGISDGARNIMANFSKNEPGSISIQFQYLWNQSSRLWVERWGKGPLPGKIYGYETMEEGRP
jgi:hypothetical protein